MITKQIIDGKRRVVITHDGESHTIAEWAEIIGVGKSAIKNRIDRGLPLEDVLITVSEYADRTRRIKQQRAACEQIEAESAQPIDKTPTLCWRCQNAVPSKDETRGCSWSRKLTPVDGWDAVKTRIRLGTGRLRETSCSYQVLSCPEFLEDEL